MSIFSFVRSGRTSTSSTSVRRRGLRHRSNRAIQAACTEALEGRRLLSVSLIDQNADNSGPASGTSFQNFGPFISADGRYVAFDSAATDLTTSGLFTPGHNQVYVRDRTLNSNILVSVDRFGQSADEDSWVADITPDGRYVLFFSRSDNLVPNDADGLTDLFVRDLQTNVTTLVSVDTSGQAAGISTVFGTDTPNYPAYISDDARYVGFISPADVADRTDNKATPTAADDQNDADDVFVRDLQDGITYLATVASGTTGAAAAAGTIESFDMSADGTVVAYATDSDDIVTGDAVGTIDAFRRDVLGGDTTLLSDADGPVGASAHVVISADGSTVAYLNSDPNIAGNGATPQMIVWSGGTNRIASGPPSGDPTGAADGYAALSADGRYVFFYSNSTDLVPGVGLAGTNVFRRDMQLGYTEVVSYGSAGATGAGFRISVTADGRYATWADDSTGADPDITTYPPGAYHVYVRDMLADRPTLLDVSTASITTAADGTSYLSIISADATLVAFTSYGSTNLPGASPNPHVYVADVPRFDDGGTGTTQPFINLYAPGVTNGGATSYTFQVTYFSPRSIVESSLDDNDIYVQLGSGTKYNAILVTTVSSADGKLVTGTYRIVPPGGAWDANDNGDYVIHLNAHQVSDLSGYEFVDQDLGTFTVNVPADPSVGPTKTVSIPEEYLTDNPLSLGFPIEIIRNDAGSDPATIDYRVVPGSASYPADFTVSSASGNGLSGTLTLLPGTPAIIYIKPVDDTMIEAGETLTILLSNATATTGATVPYMRYVITIVDNDSAGSGTISVTPSSPVEPVGGVAGSTISIENGVTTVSAPETIDTPSYAAGILPITISRADTGTDGTPVDFNYTIYSTPSDSAVAGVNFVADSGTLSFAAGELTKDLPVQLLHDGAVTGDRTFTVVLTNATTGLQVGGDSIRVVVRDVDSAVQFSAPSLTTNDDAGTLDVTVTRVGNVTPGSKVRVTFGGTAIAGQDYTVVSDGTVDAFGDITFAPGETSKVLHLQLISQDFNPGTSRTIDLGLADPRALSTSDPFVYDTVLGTPSTETITVQNLDAIAPQVSFLNLKHYQGRINAIKVTFSEAVYGAKRLRNYALFSVTPDGQIGQLIPLAKAKYNRTTHVATLIPATPLPFNQMYQLGVNGSGTLRDHAGNKLDGDANGAPTGTFNGIFGFGRALSYADRDGDIVSFSVKGQGNIKITSLNNAVTVNVLGTDDDTVLVGSVSKRNGGNGKAHLALLRLRGATFDANPFKFDADVRALKRAHN